MTKKLFLFDFDGVIVDSLELYEATTRRCFETIGKPITKNHEDFLKLFDENFYEAIQKRGIEMDEFKRALVQIAPSIDYSTVKAFAGMEPVLRALKNDNTLLIVSSNTVHAITAILSRIRYDGCFDEILGADFMLSKVDKIFHAMEKWNHHPERTFFVGDTSGDIKEARQTSVKTVAVTWGWHAKERLEKAQPDYLIESPDQLLEL